MGEGPKAPVTVTTGAENTTGRILIDWLSFTFRDMNVFDVLDLLQIGPCDEEPRGMMGYKRCLSHGHIKILFSGRPDMGCHVILPGQGVREFELSFDPSVQTEDVWRQTLRQWLRNGANFARMDIARDLYTLPVTDLILEALRRSEVCTRWRSWRSMVSGSTQGDSEGNTVYFGGAESLVRLRVYDKGLQSGIDQMWHRLELVVRKDRAQHFVQAYTDSEVPMGVLWSQVMNQYISVKQSDGTANKSRWPVSEWWSDLLFSTVRTKLTSEKPERSIEDIAKWFKRTMAPTLATLFEYKGGDMDYLKDLIKDGFYRRKQKHIDLLRRELND